MISDTAAGDIDRLTIKTQEHENQVLGALVAGRLSAENILTKCRAEDFSRPKLRAMFQHLCKLSADGVPVAGRAEIELSNALLLDDDYSADWIGSIGRNCDRIGNLWHATELRKCAIQWRLVKHHKQQSEDAAVPNASIDSIVEDNLRFITDIRTTESLNLTSSPISFTELKNRHPELRPVVIDEILRRGESINIIAAPKVGKSFLAANLAWCVATGRPWLSHTVTEGRVLVIDNELHPETLANRYDNVAYSMQIEGKYLNNIDFISLRGKNVDVYSLPVVERGVYTLVIIDALYRALPQGTSENDNSAMMQVYNRLDQYAAQCYSAVVVVHHSSKGAQGDKSVTDVGSGAGSISRAADSHLVIRPHEDPELCVLECATRSFKSPEPVSIQFEWPLWSAVTTTAQVKRVGRQSGEQQAKEDAAARQEILEAIPASPKRIQQKKLRERFSFGVGKFDRLVGGLIQAKQVKVSRKREGKLTFVYYSKLVSDSGNDSGNDSGFS